MKKRKNKKRAIRMKALLVILLIPIAVIVFTLTAIAWVSFKNPDFMKKSANTLMEWQGGTTIPEHYIPIYQEAAEIYNIPWTLLAAHHRIETRF